MTGDVKIQHISRKQYIRGREVKAQKKERPLRVAPLLFTVACPYHVTLNVKWIMRGFPLVAVIRPKLVESKVLPL